jgi:hypothetical protein
VVENHRDSTSKRAVEFQQILIGTATAGQPYRTEITFPYWRGDRAVALMFVGQLAEPDG